MEEEKLYQEAEKERLLYVAATRARDILVVSTYSEKPEGRSWSEFYPFMEDVPVLKIEYDAAVQTTESGGMISVEGS